WAAFLAAGTIRSLNDIDRLAKFIGFIVIAEAFLGLVQFYLPPGHPINRYDLPTDQISRLYGRVRAVGTFSYISGMAVISVAGSWVASYLFLSGGSIHRRLFALGVAISGIMCALVSMSRAPLIICLFNFTLGVLCFRRPQGLLFIGILAVLCLW